MKKQRNSEERAAMLALRIQMRRARGPGLSMRGFPASINRHTGEPHEHKRAIARRLARAA